MLVLHAQLHRIEKFLHGIVEDTEVRPASNHILIDDLCLFIELVARVEIQRQKVLILKFLRVCLAAA